ncbi:MAG: heat-shock protein Hsp20 [Myxococcaceae bacterium]|nr:heat-shock protein Hsp20 [Myxococcaceae bacterium]
MALIRRNQSDSKGTTQNRMTADPFQLMNELMQWDPFRQLSARAALGASAGFGAFDVRENNDAYVLCADLPGVADDAVELSVTGNQLHISGQRSEEKYDEGERLHVSERSYGAFVRTFTLPDGVDGDRIEANLDRGVLKITLPKKPETKPRRISLSNLLRSSNKA